MFQGEDWHTHHAVTQIDRSHNSAASAGESFKFTMRLLTLPFSALLGLALPVVAAKPSNSISSFSEWVDFHQKEYDTPDELSMREQVWKTNQLHARDHNQAFERGYTSYSKTMSSPFADLTDEEFRNRYLMEAQHCSATHGSSGRLRPMDAATSAKDHPAVDWRTKGILTAVKNQGKCGSCWTFSTSGCLEAHTCMAAGKDCTHWTGLAEEQLVECAGGFNNFGCNGGLPSQAYEYLKYNGGMATEKDYPYVAPENGGKNKCSLKKKKGWKAQVAEVYNITTKDEDDLQHAIATIGPVSIAYQVSPDFRLYSHGIYDSYNHTTNKTMCQSGSQDVNHAVVAVGLGTSAKTGDDYYIVRNSWSADWGMGGHFWIKRGENLCGLSDCASFPIVPVEIGASGRGENANNDRLEGTERNPAGLRGISKE